MGVESLCEVPFRTHSWKSLPEGFTPGGGSAGTACSRNGYAGAIIPCQALSGPVCPGDSPRARARWQARQEYGQMPCFDRPGVAAGSKSAESLEEAGGIRGGPSCAADGGWHGSGGRKVPQCQRARGRADSSPEAPICQRFRWKEGVLSPGLPWSRGADLVRESLMTK